MRQQLTPLILFISLALLMHVPGRGHAQTFQWRDANGILTFGNVEVPAAATEYAAPDAAYNHIVRPAPGAPAATVPTAQPTPVVLDAFQTRYFGGADLRQGAMADGGLIDPELFHAAVRQVNLIRSDYSGQFMQEADLEESEWDYANLTGADLTNSILIGASLVRADLTGAFANADLSGADLTEARLAGMDLTEAILRDADLRGVDLSGANLADADLEGVDLRGANLQGANLTDANLTDANLRWANFQFATVDGAIFEGANMTRTFFVGTEGMTEKQRLSGFIEELSAPVTSSGALVPHLPFFRVLSATGSRVVRSRPSWSPRQEGPWPEIQEYDEVPPAPRSAAWYEQQEGRREEVRRRKEIRAEYRERQLEEQRLREEENQHFVRFE